MTICLIESPYQAFILDQLLKQNIISKKSLYIFINDKKLENGSFLDNILEKISVPNLRLIILSKSFTSLASIIKLIWLAFFSNKLVIGDILSPWMETLSKYIAFKEIILLEDGTSQFVDNYEIEEKISNLENVVRYSLIGDETLIKNSKSKITRLNLTDFKDEITKTPNFIKEILKYDDIPLFFGAPIVSFNKYPQSKYNKICSYLLDNINDESYTCIYLKHRREISENLPSSFIKLDSGGLDFAFLKLDNDISKKILLNREIISFASTSLCILARAGLLNIVKEIKLIEISDLDYNDQNRHNDLVDFVENVLIEENVSVSVHKTRNFKFF